MRILSAGCASGEEVYTLAILLMEKISYLHGWQVEIIGIDVDGEALKHALRGEYGHWSFRGVPEAVRQQYFIQGQNHWKISPEICRWVSFRQVNLIRDPFPNAGLGLDHFDLVICRNVMIYFDKAHIALLLSKLVQSLNPDGYLMTGHGELQGIPLTALRTLIYPESILYQKTSRLSPNQESRTDSPDHTPPDQTTTPAHSQIEDGDSCSWPRSPQKSPPDLLQQDNLRYACYDAAGNPHQKGHLFKEKITPFTDVKPKTEAIEAQLATIRTLMVSGHYPKAIQQAQELILAYPKRLEPKRLIARCYANLGEYSLAETMCQSILETASFDIDALYMLSQMALDRGELLNAQGLLKKIIYLDQDCIPACLDLAGLYEQLGENQKSMRFRQTAWDRLKKLPDYTPIPLWEGVCVGDLLKELASVVEPISPDKIAHKK